VDTFWVRYRIKMKYVLLLKFVCGLTFLMTAQKQPLSRNDSAFVRDAELKYTEALAQNNLKSASHYLNEMAFRYWTHNDYPRAIEYYEKSLELNTGLGNENGTAMIYSNLGLLYADLKKHDKSLEYFQKTLAARRAFGQKEGVVQALLNCSSSLNAMKRFDESIVLLEEANALSRQIPSQDLMLEYLLKCYANLSETYEKAGNLKQSRYYYESYKIFLEKSKKADLERLRNAVEEEKLRAELAEIEEQQKTQELVKKQFELKIAEVELSKSDSFNKVLDFNLTNAQLEVLALQQKSEIDSLNAANEQIRDRATIARERSLRNLILLVTAAILAISFFIYKNYIQVKRSRALLAEKNVVIEKQNAELAGLNRIIAKHNERMKKELDVGQEIQLSMLPKTYPPTELLDMYAMLDPAREVGGDLYDFFMLDEDHLLFGIGDVSGKGVPAALFMAVTKTLVKAHGGKVYSPSEILNAVNVDITAANEQSMFVSYFLGILHLSSGRLYYSNAGHLLPILKYNGSCRKLDGLHGPVLGAIEDYTYTEASIELQPGEILLLYTDGVSEAMNEKQEVYSDERLIRCMNKIKQKDVKELINAISKDVVLHRKNEEQSDDITMLALSRKA